LTRAEDLVILLTGPTSDTGYEVHHVIEPKALHRYVFPGTLSSLNRIRRRRSELQLPQASGQFMMKFAEVVA
jgi:hypothetical protein